MRYVSSDLFVKSQWTIVVHKAWMSQICSRARTKKAMVSLKVSQEPLTIIPDVTYKEQRSEADCFVDFERVPLSN